MAAVDLVRQLQRVSWIIVKWTFSTLLGWAIVVLTVFGGWVTIAPNVVVLPPSEGADPMKPFHALFTITNQASLPIYSVKATCGEADIGGGDSVPPAGQPAKLGAFMKRSEFSAEKLTPQESHTFRCDTFWGFNFNGQPIPATSCSITINVTMRIFHIFPWSTHSEFVGQLGDDKKIHWQFKPMQEIKG
jgi:hypothetical protein